MKKIYFSMILGGVLLACIILIFGIKSSYALSTTLVDTVKNQSQTYNYTEGNGNGVYKTNEHEYRYVGANPNNYVKFNDDMYQIIGVFDDYSHGVTGKEMVKLIRARILTSSSYGVYNTDEAVSGDASERECHSREEGSYTQAIHDRFRKCICP